MNFEIRNIRSDDRRLLAQAEAYLLENPDPGVRLRPDHELERAMGTGQGIVVLDGGNLCGLSLVYKFEVPPAGPVYSEIGTMRVTANGYDLQVFLAKLHFLQILLEEDESELPPVFAVVAPNTASAHNLVSKVGMANWVPPKELEVLRSKAGVAFAEGKNVLIAPRSAFGAAKSDLRRWHKQDGVFQTPKQDRLIQVSFGWFSPEVLEDR